MQKEMRYRLVEVIGEFGIWHKPMKEVWFSQAIEKLADHLVENGVVCLPCKVGDTVYYLDGTILVESKVHCISFGGRYGTYSQGQIHIYDSDKDNITVKIEQFGKTVFLTKEEAEQKLKGGAKE